MFALHLNRELHKPLILYGMRVREMELNRRLRIPKCGKR